MFFTKGKRYLAVWGLLVLLLSFVLFGCGAKDEKGNTSTNINTEHSAPKMRVSGMTLSAHSRLDENRALCPFIHLFRISYRLVVPPSKYVIIFYLLFDDLLLFTI